MGNGPAVPFSEFFKRAKSKAYDFYTYGNYRCDNDISLSFQGSSPMGLIACFAAGRMAMTMLRRITFDEVMPHTKAVVTFKVPDPNSGKLEVEYRHPAGVYIDGSMGLNRSPVLDLQAVVEYKHIGLGCEVGFHAASASFTKYTAAIGLPQFGATLLLMDKGKTLTARYAHSINDENQITAELAHNLSSSENIITLKSGHVIDYYNTVKTEVSSNGKVSMSCEHEWRPNSFVTVSAEHDLKRSEVSPKWGLAIALKSQPLHFLKYLS